MSKGNELLSVIIVFNGDNIINTVEQLSMHVGSDILVIDNGSEENVLQNIKQIYNSHHAKIILNDKNLGIAAALNQGIKYAMGNNYSWVITFDQDSIPTQGMIRTMFNVFNSLSGDDKKRTAGLFPDFLEKSKVDPDWTSSDPADLRHERVLLGITSGSLFRTDIFSTIGLFDEKLFIDYVDHDFCLRAADSGYHFYQCSGAKLIHRLGDYTEKKVLGHLTSLSNHSALRRYYITRNRMYMWDKYGGKHPDFVRHDKKTFLKNLIKLFIEEDTLDKLSMAWKGYRDFRKGNFGKYEGSSS